MKRGKVKMTEKEPETAVYLEQAIIENARTDNEETRLKVYQELLFSDLILALAEDAPNNSEDASKDLPPAQSNAQQLSIAILSNPQGMKFAAVFTSAQAIRRWRPQGGQYATMRGQDIFKLLEPSPADVIVVNPGNTPIVVLPKAEFRQLAAGIVPKTSTTPVQIPKQNSAETDQTQKTMQISFPSNVFTDEQKQRAHEVLHNHANIVAAAIGAVQPPNAPDKNSWIRTVFLNVKDVENNPENFKALCQDIRAQIKDDNELFNECQFEVGIMPDEKFWNSLKQNNVLLFDKSTFANLHNAIAH